MKKNAKEKKSKCFKNSSEQEMNESCFMNEVGENFIERLFFSESQNSNFGCKKLLFYNFYNK